MMNTAKACLLVAALVVVAAAVAPAAEKNFSVDPDHWALAFENDTPKDLVIDDPAGRLTYYWYMVYRVSNPAKRALPCRLDLSLKLKLKDQEWVHPDVHDRVAEQQLEKKIVQKPLLNCVELRGKPIQPGETREGVAVFRLGAKARDFDQMTLFVRGLAGRRTVAGEGDPATGRKLRDRILNLKYIYVASRWTAGKELKLDDDLWTLEDVDVSNLNHTDRASDEAASKRLEALKKKAEELRKKLPLEKLKTPDTSSARRAPPGLAAGSFDEPARAKVLEALRLVAGKARTARAAFVETIGRDGSRQQKAQGTIHLGKEGKFAVERVLNAGTPQAIKELRVFDGKTLWAQTTTKEFGDNVRRCDLDKARKHWHTLDGRPEVDFATVANPVQAWRLFGNDLVHLGIERLETEGAYVFEVRPSKAFGPVLTGLLSSEVLCKAAGRRVRFWVGARSGFQLRMRVYDDDGTVVASLDCTKLELNARVPADLFAYSAPPGIRVMDVNAAMAESGTPGQQPRN